MGGQGYNEDLTKKPAEGGKLITEEMPIPGTTPDPAAAPLTEGGDEKSKLETATTEPAPTSTPTTDGIKTSEKVI